MEYALKIANVIHLFSNGDATVKQYLAKPAVMETLLHSLPKFSHDVLNLVLKSIRHISMEPTTLDLLAQAGAIHALVPFLASPHSVRHAMPSRGDARPVLYVLSIVV